jgi:hypothetical protein
MSQVIIFTNDTGGTSVCVPTGEIPIQQVQTKDIPPGVESFIVDSSTLPGQDEDFFNAWEQSNGKVTVNLTKAKNLTKERLRSEREPLLVAQDVAFQRALEEGKPTAAIVAEKNRLRDVTKLADNANSLEELRSLKVTT